MHGPVGFGKKVLLKRQIDKLRQGHLERVKNVRPNTTGWAWEQGPPVLNHGKRQMILEDKFTQIQRQNHNLFEKIVMVKNPVKKQSEKKIMNKSLNSSFRRKQLQSIQIENARLLKRLQEKKSDYEAHKMKEEWKKQKEVIKNIANFPFIIKDTSRHNRKRGFSHAGNDLPRNKNQLASDVELVRIRNIDGQNMVVTISLNRVELKIFGDSRKGKDIKIIQIPYEEGMAFIQQECGGKIENLFDRLRYNKQKDTMFLVGDGAEEEQREGLQQIRE